MSHLQIRKVGMLIPFIATLRLANIAHARDSKVFGDWNTGVSDDGSYASALTVNLDGEALAEFCYLDKHCEWRFSTQNFRCEPGVKSVMLLNSSTGTDSVETECIGELLKGS